MIFHAPTIQPRREKKTLVGEDSTPGGRRLLAGCLSLAEAKQAVGISIPFLTLPIGRERKQRIAVRHPFLENPYGNRSGEKMNSTLR